MNIILPNNPHFIPFVEAIHRAALAKASWKRHHHNIDPIDRLLVDYMAEMLPDQGLDLVLGQWPKGATRVATFSLCLFKSQTATTVIANGTDTIANVTETTYTSYARQALAQGSWGAQGATSPSTDGRKTTYGSQVTFPTVGATGDTINGLFIGFDTGAGGVTAPTVLVGQANFDDLTAISVITNDVVKVTPTIQINH